MAATEAQIRANRENARKSTGPRTEAGKAKARMNALKHGMRSKASLVLPQEDPAELEARILTWVEEWEPQNAIERALVERAAKASWALERAERYEAALISRQVRRAMLRSRARVQAKVGLLGRRLFATGSRGPLAEVNDDPAAFAAKLEDSPEGVRWLLDRWGEMRELIDGDHHWTYADKSRFVRLLGKHPFDAVVDRELSAIFLAWEVQEDGRGVDFWEQVHRGAPMIDPAFSMCRRWRELADRPADEAEARTLLRAVVDAQVERLRDRLAEVEEVEGDDALELAERASFLAGDAGERLRRLQSARAREMFRAVQTLAQLRKSATREHRTSSPLEGEDRPRSGRMRGTTAVGDGADPTAPSNAGPVVPLIRPCGPPSPTRGEGRIVDAEPGCAHRSDDPHPALRAILSGREKGGEGLAVSQNVTNEADAAASEPMIGHEVASKISVPSLRKRTGPRAVV